MKMNTTGKADIIIKSYSDYNENGKTFKRGQPISILKNASYSLSFSQENREIKAGVKNIGGFSYYAPYQIEIEPINITRSLAEILYSNKIKNKNFFLAVNETQVSNEVGEIFFRERNDDGSISEKEVFIIDENGDLVAAEIDYQNGIISNLAAEKQYNISYYIEEEMQFGYNLGKTRSPYFTIEIINRDDYGIGGIDTFVKIPKAALQIDLNLNFEKDNITNTSLVFNVLEEDIEIIFH